MEFSGLNCALRWQRHCLVRHREKNNTKHHEHSNYFETTPLVSCRLRFGLRVALRRTGSDGSANSVAFTISRADSWGTQETAASRADERLCLPASRASFEQHRTAPDRFGAGAKGGRICGRRIEGAR